MPGRSAGLCWPAAARVVGLIGCGVLSGLGAQFRSRHRLEDAGCDREALLPPALRLGAVQHVMGEQTEFGRRGHRARELASEMQILGDMSSVPPAVKLRLKTERGILSKVRLAPALNGTICATRPGSTPALAAISSPSRAATKLV